MKHKKYHTVGTVLKYHTVGTVPKSNRTIVERSKMHTPMTFWKLLESTWIRIRILCVCACVNEVIMLATHPNSLPRSKGP
jgi:hypothetical protein